MAAFEVIALDTATPQLRAPGASDTYTFPRAVELPLGTANGVLYLNGSKVVTSGSALTFDGTNFKNAGAVVSGVSGSAGTFTLNRSSDGNGIAVFESLAGTNNVGLRNAQGDILFSAAGSEGMRLTSTGLGIGTSSPAYKLDVFRGTTNGAVAQFTGNNASRGLKISTAQTSFADDTVVLDAHMSTYGTLQLATGGTVRATLDSVGNLGLGVTPSAWGAIRAIQAGTAASFSGGSGFNDAFVASNAFYDGANWKYINTNPAYYASVGGSAAARWYTSTDPTPTAGNPISFSQVMTLDASGRFLVGTTAPVTQITFSGSDGITYQRSTDNTFSGVLDYLKSRGSAASPTAVQNGDDLFTLRVAPYHGSAYTYLTNTVVQVDGTFTSGQNPPTRISWYTNVANGGPTERARIPAAGGMVVGTAALATTATDGFLYVPTCAGTPTGTPTTQTGTAPIVVDTTNNKLYFYSGGQWRDAGP